MRNAIILLNFFCLLFVISLGRYCDAARLITNSTLHHPSDTTILSMVSLNGFLIVSKNWSVTPDVYPLESYDVSLTSGFNLISSINTKGWFSFLVISPNEFLTVQSDWISFCSVSSTGVLNIYQGCPLPAGILQDLVPQVGSNLLWTTAQNGSVFSFDTVSLVWTEQVQHFMKTKESSLVGISPDASIAFVIPSDIPSYTLCTYSTANWQQTHNISNWYYFPLPSFGPEASLLMIGNQLQQVDFASWSFGASLNFSLSLWSEFSNNFADDSLFVQIGDWDVSPLAYIVQVALPELKVVGQVLVNGITTLAVGDDFVYTSLEYPPTLIAFAMSE